VNAQVTFFAAARPWQPVVGTKAIGTPDPSSELAKLAKQFAWPKGQWPTVRHMARSANLEYLYDYMYAATSEWVHFSPRMLLRMGWGNCPNPEIIRDVDVEFSTSHFSGYYAAFAKTYSLYLLALGLRRLAPILDPSFDLTVADGLDRELARSMRWPELITFEELNLKPPSTILSLLARVAHGHSLDESATDDD
jgi:hypothetical protein